MASYGIRISIIFILLALHLSDSLFPLQPTTISVKADDALIHQQCQNALYPETCIQCLKSDPASEKANAFELAVIMVDYCLVSHASNLQGNMSMLASNTTEALSKQVYGNCSKWFSDAKSELYNATVDLQNRDFDKADHSVFTAGSYSVGCEEMIREQSLKINVPDEVVFEKKVYQELCEAALRIINRLD